MRPIIAIGVLLVTIWLPAVKLQQHALFVKKDTLGSGKRVVRQTSADQMVQNILQWLQGVYTQNSRRIRQGTLREYLPPSNTQKPRPFEPLIPNGNENNFHQRGYAPAGSITPQPPFVIETTRATGFYPRPPTDITPPVEIPDYNGYPTSVKPHPPFPNENKDGYPGPTDPPFSTGHPSVPITGYPSGPSSTHVPDTGYPSTGHSTDYPAQTTGYPGPSTGYPNPSTGYPSPSTGYPNPSTGYPGPITGPTTGYPSTTIRYPSPSTGYPGPSTNYPEPSTGYPGPATSRPSASTDYSISTTGYPGPSTGYPGPNTGYPGPSTIFPGPSTPKPFETRPPFTGYPTVHTTGIPSHPSTETPTTLSSLYTSQPAKIDTTYRPSSTETTPSPDENNIIHGNDIDDSKPDNTEPQGTIRPPSDEDLKHPPHIHDIVVECAKDMMTINIEFNRQFDGVIYSKGYYHNPACRYVQENSGQTKYSFTVNLNNCGTEFVNAFDTQGQSYLENILVLQNEPGIQEVWDTIRSVRCLWEGSLSKNLSVALSVGMLNQEIVTFSGDTAMARLDIQIGKGPFAPNANGLVKIGEVMTLVVSVTGDPGFDIQVKDCKAKDSTGENEVALTDDDGCVLKPKLFGAFQKTRNTGNTGASIIAYAFFNAFKFPDIMDLVLECNIELCKTDCDVCPLSSQPLEPGRRRRRRDLRNETIADPITIGKKLSVILPEDISDGKTIINLTQSEGVCMSTVGFVISSALLISILTTSSLFSAHLWLKHQRLHLK